MKSKRNLLQIAFLGVLLLALPAVMQAQYTFTTNEDALTITGYTGAGGDLNIPNSFYGFPIVSIGQDAFYDASLTSVTVPGSVTSVGYEAFGQCTNLTAVTLPNGVTNIGDYGFFRCNALTNIVIPTGVTIIRTEAFGLCSSLETVTIPSSVTNIQGGAFEDCTSLTAVYFQGNAPVLASEGFDGVAAAKAYYMAGTTGWGAMYGPLTTVLLNTSPAISGVGVQANQFGFTFSGASNQVIVVEACTNLVNANWQPVQTNTVTGAPLNFTDSQWTNYPQRFYRLHSL